MPPIVVDIKNALHVNKNRGLLFGAFENRSSLAASSFVSFACADLSDSVGLFDLSDSANRIDAVIANNKRKKSLACSCCQLLYFIHLL